MIIKTPEQIEHIKDAMKIVSKAHRVVSEKICEGMSTYQVENIVKHVLKDAKAKSPFHRYKAGSRSPFPRWTCISVNEEVVHGIAQHNKILRDGDIVTVDIGSVIERDGTSYYGDAAVTHMIGNVEEQTRELVEQCRTVLYKAIEMTGPDVWLFDISKEMNKIAIEKGFGNVKGYYGHGVGLALHELPAIPAYVPEREEAMLNVKLQSGMIITYEPILTLGSCETEELSDGWTVVTKDRSIAAHWEHSVLITSEGFEVLTEQ